jgi:TonB-dependent SusC/RagA subfamily outer membrane receptor
MRALPLLAVLVVAGCGSSDGARERARDGDFNTVQREDVRGSDLARIEDMLRGRIAGVQVRYEGGGLIIRIRGAEDTGISGGDPLFVLDGLPIQQGADGALVGLNPRDVETIRVLKSASETALYGSRGANGVVLITTRRPPPPPADGDDAEGGDA